MTDEQLQEIQARCEAATAGPWHREGDAIAETDNYELGVVPYLPDAEFIAHARTDVPALVAALRELRAVARAVTGWRATCCICRTGPWQHQSDCPIGRLATLVDGGQTNDR